MDQEGIPYESIELDDLEGNKGNEMRAVLGKMTKRTSVPSIFINGKPIGGLNDGFPGLMPLATSGELQAMLQGLYRAPAHLDTNKRQPTQREEKSPQMLATLRL